MTKRRRGRRPTPRPVVYDVDAIFARLESRGSRNHDPSRLDEWQFAADGAAFCLLLDACRQYGLVTGGPTVNVARCEAIIRRAADRGIEPRPADELVASWLPAFLA